MVARADISASELNTKLSQNKKKKDRKSILDSLVVHFRRLNVCGNRIRKVPKFGHIGGTRNINALGMIIQRRISCAERRWQATIHGRVYKLRALGKKEFSQVMKTKAGLLHRVGDSHSLEITAVMNGSRFTIDEGIIRR